MIPFDAALLAVAADAVGPRARWRMWAALAPWAMLAASMPHPQVPGAAELLRLAPALLAAFALGRGAAPALVLCIPAYAGAADAALASGLWSGCTLALEPAFRRFDRAALPASLAGAPIRLLCVGGLACALHPWSVL